MGIYFYTVEVKGKKYRATAPYYQWKKVEEYLGVPRSQITRGACSRLPSFSAKED